MSMRLLGAGIAAALLLTAPPGHRTLAKPPDLPLDPTGKCEIEETTQQHGSVTIGVDLTGQLHVHIKTNDMSLEVCPCTSAWSMITQLSGLWYQALQKNADAGEAEEKPADEAAEGTVPPTQSELKSGPDNSAADNKHRHHPWRGHWPIGDHGHHYLGRFFHGIDQMQAERDLRVADFYRRTGHLNTAKYYYGLVCRRYDGTAAADIARKRADEISDCQDWWEALTRDFFGPRIPESAEAREKKEVKVPAHRLHHRHRISKKEGDEACDKFWLEQAKNMYLIGEWLRRDGDFGMAENCYYKARMLCPGSSWAQQARDRIAEMEQESSVPPPPVNDTDDPIPPSSDDALPPSDDTSIDQGKFAEDVKKGVEELEKILHQHFEQEQADDACDPKLLAQARHLYMVGENCHRRGDMAMADNCFRETCLICPNCSWAELARQRLAEMEREAVRSGSDQRRQPERLHMAGIPCATPNMQWAVPNSLIGSPPVYPIPECACPYGQPARTSDTSEQQESPNTGSVCPKCEELHRAAVQRRQQRQAEAVTSESEHEKRVIPEIDVLEHLIRSADELRQRARALGETCPYLQMPPSFQAEQARKLYHRGLRWEEAGDLDRARKCFQAAHKACPDCSFAERAMQHLVDIEKRDTGTGEEQEEPPTPKESKDEARARRLLQGTVPIEIYLNSDSID